MFLTINTLTIVVIFNGFILGNRSHNLEIASLFTVDLFALDYLNVFKRSL